ncbi:MAG: nuclear transport factor 2 family protein [bacterium]
MAVTLRAVQRVAEDYTAAWNSKSPQSVAAFYAEDGVIVINRGEPWSGRSRVADMVAGFHADVPDLTLTCDEIRLAGSHAVYVWTFTGRHARTGNPLSIKGWEEWEFDDALKVKSSLGWFDGADYDRQVEGT